MWFAKLQSVALAKYLCTYIHMFYLFRYFFCGELTTLFFNCHACNTKCFNIFLWFLTMMMQRMLLRLLLTTAGLIVNSTRMLGIGFLSLFSKKVKRLSCFLSFFVVECISSSSSLATQQFGLCTLLMESLWDENCFAVFVTSWRRKRIY